MQVALFLLGLFGFAVSQILFFIAIASHRAAPRRRKGDFAVYLMLIAAAAVNLVLYAWHLGVFVAAELQGADIWNYVMTVLS